VDDLRIVQPMRVLALDPGERRVGIAVSDPRGVIAVPHSVFARQGKADAADLAALAQREGAEIIVVGLPLSLDGSSGPQAKLAERFGRAVQAASGLPIVFWDERFSSREASRRAVEAGMSRRRRRAPQDAAAAAIILQDYLDCQPRPADPEQ
jgi:putative holliday junction resolvase